ICRRRVPVMGWNAGVNDSRGVLTGSLRICGLAVCCDFAWLCRTHSRLFLEAKALATDRCFCSLQLLHDSDMGRESDLWHSRFGLAHGVFAVLLSQPGHG